MLKWVTDFFYHKIAVGKFRIKHKNTKCIFMGKGVWGLKIPAIRTNLFV